MDVITSKNVLLGNRWKLPAAILWQKQSPGLCHGAQLEPQLKQPPSIFLLLFFFFALNFSLSSPPVTPNPPPSFFPTGLWAPLAELLVPSSPLRWRGAGHWSGAWAGATIPHRRRKSGTAGTSTKCRWWCATSWSPATSVWSCWPHRRWALPCSSSSIIVRLLIWSTQLNCLHCTAFHCNVRVTVWQ